MPTLPLVLLLLARPAGAQLDVPAAHWAHTAVSDVVSRGVMQAPGGKFQGSRPVTRRELAGDLMRFAQSLQRGDWPKTGVRSVREPAAGDPSRPITRYELAGVLSRMARYAAQGLPRFAGKAYLQSEALPPRPRIQVPRTDPAYPAVAYLVQNRMAFASSIVLQPSNQPVTAKQASMAVAQVIVGVDDLLTDEPQNREDLGPPPGARGRSAPRRAQ